MSTEAVVSDHTSATATDEVEKKENDAVTANGQKSASLSNASEEKHDKVEDTTLSETETEDKKPEAPVVEVEKTDDSPAEEKEAIPDSQTTIATDIVPEKESADTGEQKQRERGDVPQSPAEEIIEESSKTKPLELNPQIETSQEPEEQPNTVANPESPAESIEKSEAVEEKTREPEPDAEVVKPEPVIAQVEEKSQEQEKESPQNEREQEDTAVVVPEALAETIKEVSEAVEDKQEDETETAKENETSETGCQKVERHETIESNPTTESEAEASLETSSDKVEKSEPVVVEEKSKEASEKGDEEKENTVAVLPEDSSGTIEKVSDAVKEKPREIVKETEEPEPAVTKIEENPSEPEGTFVEKGETAIPETTVETTEKPLDVIEDHSTKESDIDVVKEAALPVEPQDESEKPKEQSQVAQVKVEEKSKDVETNQEGTLDTLVPTSLKEGKTQKEEEGTLTNNSEAQVAPVEEEHKKVSSYSGVVQDLAKDAVGVSATTDAETDEKEPSVEEKVAANDVKESSKEAVVETHKAGEQNEAKTSGTDQEAGEKVESVEHEDGHQESKAEEVMAAVTEPVRETLASKFQEKEEETKSETQQVEDTMKTREPSTKENDTIKTTKDLPKETPAKSAHKQSNNILSKVKQSLAKAKKALTGKSPNSKTLSSDTQGDIQVK